MSTATSGRAREYKVRDHLISMGWTFVNRSAASKGAMDLILASEERGLIFVQAGTEKSKSLGPADRERFVHISYLASAVPVIATVERGKFRYREVTLDKPAKWPDWDPEIPTIRVE